MAQEHPFMTAAHVAQKPEVQAAPEGTAGLVGTWENCDPATRGLVRIVIAASGGGITVHAFGACVPTPCDWGPVPGLSYAADVSSSTSVAFSANYKFDFVETILTGVLDRGSLVVESFEHFVDGSGRSDYYSKAYLCRH